MSRADSIYSRIRLSERLEMSVNMIGGYPDLPDPYGHADPAGEKEGDHVFTVADIGCDHAHTDIWLIKNGIAGHCIGMDVRPGPLKKAAENLKMYDCTDQVELRLSDGFEALNPQEADVAVIAGMGGIVMRNILERGLGNGGHLKDSGLVLILQPQSHIYEVRKWLYDNGYEITDEDMCFEDGKYYFSMKALWKRTAPDHEGVGASGPELHFGPVLLRNKPMILHRYLRDSYYKALRRLEQINNSDSPAAYEKKVYFEKIVEMIGEFTWITLK